MLSHSIRGDFMFYWVLCISMILYILGFIINKQHKQLFSSTSIHMRWWFSSSTIVSLGICIEQLSNGVQNIKVLVFGSISSLLFLIISWVTKDDLPR